MAGLKARLYSIESGDEPAAMAGMSALLGVTTWTNDGGKWRLRWRADRAKVQRVFASLVEEMGRGVVRTPGGLAEWTWKKF